MRLLALSIGISMAIGYPLVAQRQPSQLQKKLSIVADGMSATLPKAMSGGSTLQAITARGKVLTLRFSDVADWRPELTDADMSHVFSRMLCRPDTLGGIIAEGASIRVEMTDKGGATLPTLAVERCSEGG